jgi:uncharacterized membrane protein
METTTSIQVRADRDVVYALASAVERWPAILPHYRWVRVLQDEGTRRVVEMAARRDAIPVRWTAIQELYPEERRIAFRHIGGITRGMEVAWTLVPNQDGVHVRIWHAFRPRWPLVPDALVRLVVGQFFVHNIASRTLRRIKELAEADSSGRSESP